jgi:flagellar basal-body rod modification protein FlgD
MTIFHTNATDPAAQQQSSDATVQTPQDPLTNKETFLQLLVAQIKNQDPMNPSDGTQFLSQLAQFTQLEQTMDIRQDVESIGTTLNQAFPTTDSSTGSGT